MRDDEAGALDHDLTNVIPFRVPHDSCQKPTGGQIERSAARISESN